MLKRDVIPVFILMYISFGLGNYLLPLWLSWREIKAYVMIQA